MKNILISGGYGRFGNWVRYYALLDDYNIYSPTSKEMDVTDFESINSNIIKYKPDVFIHSAALTRPLIVHENEPYKSIETNIIGTSNVVLACMKHNIKLVYISTDYVYEGSVGNYDEESPVKPFNNYGWSKLGGECSVKLYENSLILRIAMMNKPILYPKALVDVKRSLLFDEDAAKITLKLLDNFGTINVGYEPKSIYDFTKEYNPNVGEISLSEVSDIKLPSNTSVNVDKMNKLLKNKKKDL
jgi:dTDP-4-dehydrorhamnose reductase